MSKKRVLQDENEETTEYLVDIMHERNIYKDNSPNFLNLAEEYEFFRPFVKEIKKDGEVRGYIDFKNPNAVRELTCCLLKRDFKLSIEIPLNWLCPPIPNWLNYILWIEDLLNETTTNNHDNQTIYGIDIGIGASCIYPLLGCQQNQHWKFLGTEIDQESLNFAKENVNRNQLQDRIFLFLNDDPNRIFLLNKLDKSIQYSFCMCNPPFFESEQELKSGLENKELEPSAVCTGTPSEMITDGGEFGFIQKMIIESLKYKQRILWYTTMIGLKKTIRPIIQILKQHDINNYVVTEFCQGRTKRWGLAWSFTSNRIVKSNSLEYYRPKSQFTIDLPVPLLDANKYLDGILNDLDIDITSKETTTNDLIIIITPTRNTWSRSARRQRKRQKLLQEQQGQTESIINTNEQNISLKMEFILSTHKEKKKTCHMDCSWLQGDDRSLFESLWNHIKKRMEQESGIVRGSAFQE
ncbi:unnamed protein product [Cunninghamella echinulata]